MRDILGGLIAGPFVSWVTPPLQDKLERVLDLSRQQMEQYREQLGHSQKIAYQQRLLQEDLVAIRAQISRVSTVSTLINLIDNQHLFWLEVQQHCVLVLL